MHKEISVIRRIVDEDFGKSHKKVHENMQAEYIKDLCMGNFRDRIELPYPPFIVSEYTFENYNFGDENKIAVEKLNDFMCQESGGAFILYTKSNETSVKRKLYALSHAVANRYKTSTFFTAEIYASMVIEALLHGDEAMKRFQRSFYNADYPDLIIEGIHFVLNMGTGAAYLSELIRFARSHNRHMVLTLEIKPEIEIYEQLEELLLNADGAEIK